MTITKSEINSFRFWTNDYVTKLQAAQSETGTGYYRTVNGFQCHNPIYNMDANAENKDSACGQFLQLLGFTDENFAELEDIWDEDVVEHIHYVWQPVYQFTEGDFDFFMHTIEAEMSDVSKIVISHEITRYDEDHFEHEDDRVAISIQDAGYDILKADNYALDVGPGPGDPGELGWVGTGTTGIEKLSETSLYYGLGTIRFYDGIGVEIIKDSWLQPALKSLITVSLNEAITTVSLTKTGEDDDGGLIGDQLFTIEADEEIDINYAACTYDRYYIGDTEDYYMTYDPYGYYTNAYAPYYVNLFWATRKSVLNSENPVNNEIGMFEHEAGSNEYFLRVKFQEFASPDEIAYLFSAFSYVEIEEEEKKGGFIRGIIGAILYVVGAYLFFCGATTAAQFLWKMAAVVVGVAAKQLYIDKMEASYDEMMAAQEDAYQAQMQEQKQEAFSNNRADLSYTFDYYDKLEPINPFEAGAYMPLNSCASSSNPYSVGGEYWQPHTKLVNQRDIL